MKSNLNTKLKPRNGWQKAYEILVKINILRNSNGLSRIQPVGMEPMQELSTGMVYGMTKRILAELKIFEIRKNIEVPNFKLSTYKNKTSLDICNSFHHTSISLNELNRRDLSPAHVFAETMRIYDDLSIILKYLGIKDETIPAIRKENTTPTHSLATSMMVVYKIQKLQRSAGIQTVDFSIFNKNSATPSDVYTVTGIILSELQTLKAYVGIKTKITPPALKYTKKKTPADINQLMSWNLRKLSLITDLDRR